jgi:hypothetical protein
VTLRLPDPHVFDESTRRNFERVAQNFPLECSADNFRQVPQARVYHNANQAIANNAMTALAFNSERWDLGTPNLDMHDMAANNSRLTCRVPGLYLITGCAEYPANANGVRGLEVFLNGATSIAWEDVHADDGVSGTDLTITTTYRLAVGDYVELRAYQTSGGNLNVNAVANYSPEFQMVWLSP